MAHSLWHLPAQELIEAVHLHLVKEYIIRLSKRRLVLKTAEQQQQLARHILANADAIQHFCTESVSAPTHPKSPRQPHRASPSLGIYCSKYLLVPLGERDISLHQPSSFRAPLQPGCTLPSLRSLRLFACKIPVPSRSRWPHMPLGTLTSGKHWKRSGNGLPGPTVI